MTRHTDLLAAEVQYEHVLRLDTPDDDLQPRPFRARPRPKTALIAEACAAKFKRRDGENFRPSTYAGMRTVISRRIKYRDCEYVRERGQSVRKLSAREIDEFHAAVQRAHEAAS